MPLCSPPEEAKWHQMYSDDSGVQFEVHYKSDKFCVTGTEGVVFITHIDQVEWPIDQLQWLIDKLQSVQIIAELVAEPVAQAGD